MKLKVLMGISLTFIVCATEGKMMPAQATNGECVQIGKLIEATGNVQLQRFGVGEFFPTSLDAKLCAGDRLQVAGSTNARMFCFEKGHSISIAPGKPWEVNAFCPKPSKSILTPGGPIPNTRGSEGKLNMITPSDNTALLNVRPVFRWHRFEGASSYTLQLLGAGVNWKRDGVTETELAYPADVSELKYDNTYVLKISAQNHNSTEDLVQQTVTFFTLDEDDAEVVQEQEQTIKQNYAGATQVLALVGLYRQYNLNIEAIEILESSLKGILETADVYLSLGELYWLVGHYEEALNRYKQAFERAKSTGNLAVQKEAEIQIRKLEQALESVAF